MSNAFLDESRSERIDLGLPFLKQIRASPTIVKVLSEEKPANQSWGDFFLSATINHVLNKKNVLGDWRACHRLLGRMIGPEPDGLGVTPEQQMVALTGVRKPATRQGGR